MHSSAGNLRKESRTAGRIGGAEGEEEITSAWASCRGLEASQRGSWSWREGKQRSGPVWPPVSDVAGGLCISNVSVGVEQFLSWISNLKDGLG